MKVLPINPAASDSPEALAAFLSECRDVARFRGHPQLVSITLPVAPLDPLAVLESIFEAEERHFYLEKPAEGLAVAAAEAVLSFECEGPTRVAALQDFVNEALEHTIAVGDLALPWSGPHFFTTLTFAPENEPEAAFRPGTVFVPRWQVATAAGATVAVANVLVGPEERLEPVLQRLWRARKKFGSFDYSAVDRDEGMPRPRLEWQEVGPEAAYEESVSRAVQKIRQGAFTKIVLARAREAQADRPLHPLRILNGLRERFPDCYAFSTANGRGQSFIGATPERLARVDGGRLETEALAGSVRRGATASEDAMLGGGLLRSMKDRGEQQVVVDSIVRRLAPLGIRPSFDQQPRLRRLANIQHLHTAIRGVLPAGVGLLQVVDALHPTPAVGGSPREAAVPCIQELETFARGLYAGALGWIDHKGNGEFVVGLRSALIDGARARLYAGAGIVADSEPLKERQETDVKFKAMAQAIADHG